MASSERESHNEIQPEPNMGVEQSRETVNANLRSAAVDVRNGSIRPKKAPARQSTGKLVRLSNPAYRNPLRPTSAVQRKLPPASARGRSTYELDSSPEPSAPKSKETGLAGGISPTKKQRKAAKQIAKQTEPAEEPDAELEDSARRSTRQQDQRQAQDAGADVAAEAVGFDSDEIQVAVFRANRPPRVGRPPKAPQVDSSDGKRKRGRPKKSNDHQSNDEETAVVSQPAKPTVVGSQQTAAAPEEPAQSSPGQRGGLRRGAVQPARQRTTRQRPAEKNSASDQDIVLQPADVEHQEAGEVSQGENEHEPPERDLIRPSELFVNADSDESEAEDEPEPESSAPNGRSLKRKATSSRANTSQKRVRIEASEEDTESNGQRLYGQWKQFRQIVTDLKEVGCNTNNGTKMSQNVIDLDDKDVREAIKLCKTAKKLFARLENSSGEADDDQDPLTVLEKIYIKVGWLRGLSATKPDTGDRNKCTQIYFHLIPELVRLTQKAITCYETLDKDKTPTGQIQIENLRIVSRLIQNILDLETAAKQNYVRPDPADAVVRPVHDGIAIPLRGVQRVLTKRIFDHQKSVLAMQKREQEAQERAVRLEQEERQEREDAYYREQHNKWSRLHDERMWAEGGIMKQHKQEYLRMPGNDTELDQDGMPFVRVGLFHPRIGPTPGLVDEAASNQWSLVELNALCDGLKQYTGPNVFEKIFRKYCGQRKELNRYNVTDIVGTAASLRENLIAQQTRDYGDVEEWVTAIPVWTKGHRALGKENEGGDVVDLTAE